jgi:hypothetical protein
MAEKDTKNTQSADGGAGNVQPAPAPVDMSNTYEHGVPGANINAAVPIWSRTLMRRLMLATSVLPVVRTPLRAIRWLRLVSETLG